MNPELHLEHLSGFLRPVCPKDDDDDGDDDDVVRPPVSRFRPAFSRKQHINMADKLQGKTFLIQHQSGLIDAGSRTGYISS